MAKLGVIGSGKVGQSLADGLLRHGHEVMRGTREPRKLADWKEKAGSKAQVGSFAEAARWGEVVVLAIKGSAAEAVVDQIGADALSGKPVIDTTNPIAEAPPVHGVLKYFTSLDESLMERLQRRIPAAKFVKAFSCIGNAFMVDPQFPGGPPTMFICGDDAGAKAKVSELLGQLGWEVADMGGVEGARAIEPLCMLWCIPGLREGKWGHALKLLRL